MLQVTTFTFNAFAENTFVAYDEASKEAAVIDPGCYIPEEGQQLLNYIEEEGLTVTYLLSTHAHIDHVLGNKLIKDTYQVPYLLHEKDVPTLLGVKSYKDLYGFSLYEEVLPDDYLKEGTSIKLGDEELKILYVPGHAPGHVAFYHEGSMQLVTGDVIFEGGGMGRTDLPGGSMEVLVQSIKTLLQLPDETVVYSGHGGQSTIGKEKLFWQNRI